MKVVVLNFSTYSGLDKNLSLSLGEENGVTSLHQVNNLHSIDQLPNIDSGDFVWVNSTVRSESCFNFLFLESLWGFLKKRGCFIVQNNFEYLKNNRHKEQVDRLNALIDSNVGGKFFKLDLNLLASMVGLNNWHNDGFWYTYRIPYDQKFLKSVICRFKNIFLRASGGFKKCIVVDLDNTLWHGIIGDDGVERIRMSMGDPIGEAHRDFQKYLKNLKTAGVLLAVCSKNEIDVAKSAFNHPDCILGLDDFVVFVANWDPKHANIAKISNKLNLSFDSFVFIDDNPAERELVRANLPGVCVPEIGDDITKFIDIIEEQNYFKVGNVTEEDKSRSTLYKENFNRDFEKTKFEDHQEFLESIEMFADIKHFDGMHTERISQLSKRTNQFNLTTKRYEFEDIKLVFESDSHISLYGKLVDKFGDNGLVSVIIGEIKEDILFVDLWIMSCRVFNRDLEYEMFKALLRQCRARGVKSIIGMFVTTKKNNLVSDFYNSLGFEFVKDDDTCKFWKYNVKQPFVKNTHISVAGV